MRTDSAFAAPTLPKGGGAIRGIGEKLSPNLVTGTGSLSIPVYTTPSRGLHPELMLAYDSGGGNGPFGIGWRLSILSITRRTDRGIPRYADADDSDTFVLSGSEDLVPSLRPEDDFVDPARNARVRRYRPRVEGAFARIERVTDSDTGQVSWTVTMRDGTTHRFGATAQARVADPTDPRRIFAWHLEESRDLRGSIAQYLYKPEDDAQVPRDPAEDSRRGRQANLYLKRILYGNRAPNDVTSWCFQVVLDYGEHGAADTSTETGETSTWPTPDDSRALWTYRADPFSTYRASFEIRTRRLCRRILMFHRFDELGEDWTLVRSTDLSYAPTPVATYLEKATQTGWMPGTKKSLPALELGYAQPVIDTIVRELTPDSLDGLRGGVDPSRHAWEDLDGEGIAGLLYGRDQAWWYRRNLGDATLAPPEALPSQPSAAAGQGKARLMDLAGAGVKDLVVLDRSSPGFYERTAHGRWESFRPFGSLPTVDFDDPSLRQLDLDGDGLVDLLVNDDDVFVSHLSLGRAGFGEGTRTRKEADESAGPVLAFAESLQTIFLADMTGDGLTDLVRIRNGEICYWPNLGYGRFGAKVAMGNAPVFDGPDLFDPARIRLGDIDGSGTTDIVYLGIEAATAYFNESGNRWSGPRDLRGFPPSTKLETVQLLDLLGNGTSCLVWMSAAPHAEHGPIRYLDLMGGLKPHLLVSVDNHLGRTVTLTYAPSTRFYLADRAAGTPWITRLPFPVHVVARVDTHDHVARTRLVTRYEYHHGYFDGVEREFRGFGRVDTFDAESIGVAVDDTSSELDLPPVVTKTWFHTGVFPGAGSIARHLAREYYAGDPVNLGESLAPAGLRTEDAREACRALKGNVLREEVYALDRSDVAGVPFAVREHTYSLVPIALQEGRAHGVWFATSREALEIHYERRASDPRIAHTLTLAVDAYGNVTDSAQVAYERRANAVRTQGQRIITYAHHAVANVDTTSSYLVGLPVRSESFEVLALPAVTNALVDIGALALATSEAYATRRWIPIDDPGIPSPTQPTLRELARERTIYWDDAQAAPLPEGQVGTRALVRSTDTKVLSAGQPARLYAPRLDAAMLVTVLANECKLVDVDGDGGLWAPSPVMRYAPAFLVPLSQTDPFGNTTTIARDAYALFVTSMTDPVRNIARSVTDYRVALPAQVTDPNGTTSTAAYDPLGMLLSVKVDGTDGHGSPRSGTILAFEYVLDAWDNAPRRPSYVRSRALEDWGPTPLYRESYTYSDGTGREAMKKVQAEPGDAPQLDANGHVVRDAKGEPIMGSVSARWAGSGRTVFDKKGNPVKKYEPYFSATSAYEDEPDLVHWGVTPVLRYDALGRLVRTDFPDGTIARVVFDAWTVEHWDQNDTVVESAWYAAITSPAPGAPASPPELVRAATLAAAHKETPAIDVLDPLGRAVSTIVDLGGGKTLETQQELDAAGNVRAVIDPRGLTTRQVFDLAKRAVRTTSPDSGDRAVMHDPAGAVTRTLTARGFSIAHTYDEARRPAFLHVQAYGSASKTLVERTIYGEALDPGKDSDHAPVGRAINARGRVYQRYDGAGLETQERYDLRGNVVRATRKLAKQYRSAADWSALDGANLTLSQLNARAVALLEDDTFATETDHDARDRATRITTHDRSETYSTYNEAGLLETVAVKLRGSAGLTPFVTGIDYNARGQRVACHHANGASVEYRYDRRTFRLVELKTTSAGKTVQDCAYTYDPVGNVVQVDDPAEDAWFGSAPGTGSLEYEYDASYRLTKAEGREQGTNGQVPLPDGVESPLFSIPDAGDSAKVRLYEDSYAYDDSGNLVHVQHALRSSTLPGYGRDIFADASSNRLATRTPSGAATGYGYDDHGNVVAEGGRKLVWDHADRLESVDLVGGGKAYYAYDAAGHRVRKVVERTAALVEQRAYVGGWERFSRTASGHTELERDTLHVADDKRRVALVETKTVDPKAAPGSLPETRQRWQLDNHLGSVAIELDEAGAVISYEEYYPYGGTAYLARTGIVTSSAKRYRYNGKERDDETGFNYYGARYYAPWIGRWMSADPAGSVDGLNLYRYARSNPTVLVDPDGTETRAPPTIGPDTREQAESRPRTLRTGGSDEDEIPPAIEGFHKRADGQWHKDPFDAAVNWLWAGKTQYYHRKAEGESKRGDSLISHGHVGAGLYHSARALFYRAATLNAALSWVTAAGGAANVFSSAWGYAATHPPELPDVPPPPPPPQGSLEIQTAYNKEGFALNFEKAELNSAMLLAEEGNQVILREAPKGAARGNGTSDLVVNGIDTDILAPKTRNPLSVPASVADKSTQAPHIVVDLSRTTVTREQLGGDAGLLRDVRLQAGKDVENIEAVRIIDSRRLARPLRR